MTCQYYNEFSQMVCKAKCSKDSDILIDLAPKAMWGEKARAVFARVHLCDKHFQELAACRKGQVA